MGALARAYRGETDLDFPRLWKWGIILSSTLVVVCLVSLVTRGINLSIDFSGGSVWGVPAEGLSEDDVMGVLDGFGAGGGAKVQEVTDQASGDRFYRVQAGVEDIDESVAIAAAYADLAGVAADEISTNTVGPSWGEQITAKARTALILFFIVIALYLWLRLEWKMAIGALVAVVHDIIIVVGVYSLLWLEVTPATVIAFLTILGYSLYDTIVVCDKVRENEARFERTGRMSYTAIMRLSMNQVLMRTLNTTIAAILPVIAMLTIGSLLLGEATLREFSIALLIGLISGAYSTIFIAAPAVVALKEREEGYRRIRKRLEDKGLDPNEAGTSTGAERSELTAVGRPTSRGVDSERAAKYERAHPPRPRKKGGRR
ncbi:MAG: protein translocase subunit SecF [Actinobacteria bacterium]|nr:MAG: protein translocase subunit SecF [Actinomycetota bacterium]RIK05641.1 MAG: protein translocase subunit SecF [Acidobacteriota bacterium]